MAFFGFGKKKKQSIDAFDVTEAVASAPKEKKSWFGKKKTNTQNITASADASEQANVPKNYLMARMEWNDRYANLAKTSHGWRAVAFTMLILCVLMGLGITYIGSQSKIQPFPIVVDKTNYDVRVTSAAETVKMDDRIMKGIVQREVRDFITKVRSVTPDRSHQKLIMRDVYARILKKSPAYEYVTAFYNQLDPFTFSESGSVSVAIRNVLPLTNETWQVEWIETVRNIKGEPESQKHLKANLIYKLMPPTSEKELYSNPIGFYVSNVEWQELI